MRAIFLLSVQLLGLKKEARTGWNMKFPRGHALKTRRVKNAESVADHSWSLAMLAWVVGTMLGLDVFKLIKMTLVHDVAEYITRDLPTATIQDAAARALAEADKHAKEEIAMRETFLDTGLGDWGQECYDLWRDYEGQLSPEAKLLKQLDKFEACLQAQIYAEDKRNKLDPHEFFLYADQFMKSPQAVTLMELLRERASQHEAEKPKTTKTSARTTTSAVA